MGLSWKARRKGNIYCAPACGRGCTRAEYRAAVNGAKKLCKRLGRGWRPRVNENLGWFFDAVHKSGLVTIHPHVMVNRRTGKKYIYSYWADFRFAGRQWHHTSKTPEHAFHTVIRQVKRYVEQVLIDIELVKNAVERKTARVTNRRTKVGA